MNQARIDLRIGELLIKSEVISDADLSQAMKTAESTGLPVGRVLIMAGFVSEGAFQAAVQAQSLVRDEILPLDKALEALKLVAEEHVTFAEALKRSGVDPQVDHESNKLGELLLESLVVPEEHLATAMRTSSGTGLPLGRLLVSLGLLSDEILTTALNAQTLIRSQKLPRAQAISGLRAANERRKPLEAALTEQGFYRGPHRPSIRLGELLVRSGLISKDELDDAIIKNLVEPRWIGQVFLEGGFLDGPMLESALLIQEMAANETLTIEEAVQTMRRLHATECALEEALALLELAPEQFKTKVRYIDVLKVAGLIDPSETRFDLAKSLAPSSSDALYTGRTLMQDGLIDRRVYLGSLRCYYLIATGWLNMQQGIIALNYFHHKDCTFDNVLQELKWTVKTFIRSPDFARTDAAVI
jgi:hypothetical protein